MNRRVRIVLRWAIGVALLVAVVVLFDPASIGDRIAAVNLARAVPAILGLVAVHLVAALTWRRLTETLAGVRLDRRATIRLYYAAQAFGTVTPANLGADVYRIVATDPGSGRARLVRPIVVQRLTSVVAVAMVGAAGALVLPIEGLAPFAAGVVALSLAVATATVFLATGSGPRSGFGARLARRFGLGRDDGATGASRPRSLVAVRDGVGLGLVFHVTSLMLGLVLVAAVDPIAAGRPIEIFGALAVARLSVALPLSPNGLGIQEGALSLLFVSLGLPPESALAAALLNRLALLLTAAIGSLALLGIPKTPSASGVGSAWSRQPEH